MFESSEPGIAHIPGSVQRPAVTCGASAPTPCARGFRLGPSGGEGEKSRFRNPAEIAVISKLAIRREAIPPRRRERLDRQLELPFGEPGARRAPHSDWPGLH